MLSKTILLVEDDTLIALQETRQLQKEGYTVINVYRGENAVETVRRASPAIDLVLMDINLGAGMDGTQAAQKILEERDLPIVFLSSHTEPDIVAKTEEITSYGYVVKSADITVLAASIKMAFKLHAARQTIQQTNENLRQEIIERQRAENAFQESETRYRAIFENSTEAMIFSAPDGAILDANPAACKMFGYTVDELRALGREGIIDRSDPRLPLALEECRRMGKFTGELNFMRRGGACFPVEIVSTLFTDFRGEQRTSAFLRDINERKEAENALKLKTEEVEKFFDNALDLLCIADTDGKFIRLSREWSNVLGYPLSELEGRQFLDFVHPDDLAATRATIGELRLQKTVLNFTNRYRCQDGSYRWIEWRSFPEGKRIYAAARDITAHRQAEEMLRDSQTHAQAMLRAIPDLMFRINREGVFLDYKADPRDLYMQSESIIGKRNQDISPPDFAAFIDEQIRATLETGALQTFEYQLPTPGRGMRAYEARMAVSGADEVTAIVRDVTEHKQADEALRQSKLEFASLVENAVDMIVRFDANLRHIYCNPAVEHQLGIPIEDILGKTPLELDIPPDTGKFIDWALRRALGTGLEQDVEQSFTTPGGPRCFQTRIVPERDASGTIVSLLAITRDITEHKQVEEALRLDSLRLQIQAELHQLMDAPEREFWNFIVDALARTTKSQFAFFGLLDEAESEMAILTWSKDAMAQCAVDNQPLHFPIATSGLWGECVRQRQPILINDYAASRVAGPAYPGGHVPIYRFIAVPIFDGTRIVAVAATANKAADYNHQDSVAMTTLADRMWSILHRKRADATLQQALAEKEMLMRELQHRVKNSLMTATSLLSLEQDNLPDERTRAVFASTQARIHTMVTLYDQLNRENRIDHIDLRDYLQTLIQRLVQAYLAADSPIKVETCFATLALEIKRAMPLGLILNELVTNALKYAFPDARNGVICVKLEKADDQIALCVFDNGVGFASPSPDGQHSGLGLTLVQMLAEQLSGKLVIENEQGVKASVIFLRYP